VREKPETTQTLELRLLMHKLLLDDNTPGWMWEHDPGYIN